jgi:nucleotide-binding universal stress UspA family protein
VILCPTDFSECSVTATDLAVSLSRQLEDSLCLLHVMEVPAVAVAEAPLGGTDWQAGLAETARARLDEIAEAAAAQGLVVNTRLVSGTAHLAIPDLASELNPRFVVMGTHGRRGLERLLLGSVAESVIRHVDRPVLLTRAGLDLSRWRRRAPLSIVVATDLTPESSAGIPPAYDLLSRCGGRVELAYVHAGERHGDLLDLSLAPPFDAGERARVEQRLRALEPPEAVGLGVTTVVRVAEGGTPRDVLVEMGREADVDLIAVATQAKTGAARLLLGSLAEDLARHADVPVLVTRARAM